MTLHCLQLLAQNHNPAMLSRGYGRRTEGFLMVHEESSPLEVGDEPLLVKRKLPQIPVAVCEDRLRGVETLLENKPAVNVIVLDDGYQHRALRANAYLLLTDYVRPFTRDYFLPVGRLRDAKSQRRRARIVIVTKCPPHLTLQEFGSLREELTLPGQLFAASALRYESPQPLYPQQSIQQLNPNSPLFALAAIANPAPFFEQVGRIAPLIGRLALPDHAPFTERHLETLRRAVRAGAQIITTEKDAVRLRLVLPPQEFLAAHVWTQPIGVQWLHNSENSLNQVLNGLFTENS